jgi:hypothetical protein
MVDKFGDIVENIDDMGGYIYNIGRDSDESKMGEDLEESKMGEDSEEPNKSTHSDKCDNQWSAKEGEACRSYISGMGCAQGLQCQRNPPVGLNTCISSSMCGKTTEDGFKITCGPACIANNEK